MLGDIFLDENSRHTLGNLTNNREVDHTIISGEGEPFTNKKTLLEILKLSKGGNNYQIITNGSWIWCKGEETLDYLDQMAEERGDKYSLRVSIDTYHLNEIDPRNFKEFFRLASTNGERYRNLRFALRSIVEERDEVTKFTTDTLEGLGIDFELIDESVSDQELIFPSRRISINYKNLVNPNGLSPKNAFSIWNYIDSLERKYGRDFTFGNIRTPKKEELGLDVTINPEGDILFYGIEIHPFGNISNPDNTWDHLKSLVRTNPLLDSLYSLPFKEVLLKLASNPELKRKIEKINNPYWVIRGLYADYENEFKSVLGI